MTLTLELSAFHVEQLREVIDALPIRTHGGLILALTPQLPLEAGPLDPTPWCAYGHRTQQDCNCGEIASNE